MAESTIEVTDNDFAEKVLNSQQMVIVLFTSKRSSACQIQEPEFEVISQEFQDRVTFYRVDVDAQNELTKQYNVDGIPTQIFFQNGQEFYRIPGIVMRDKLRRQISGILLTI